MSLPDGTKTFSRIILAERPSEGITASTFREERVPLDFNIGDSQALVNVLYASVDPAMRGWLSNARSYIRPIRIGETIRAQAIGVVVQRGRDCRFSVGDVVRGILGWTEYVVIDDKQLEKLGSQADFRMGEAVQMLDYLGPLGGAGLTAYFGLLDVGQVKEGETLVVSGAAGAVGSVVCQIGKIKGAKVAAIAGTDDKCAWLKDEIGVDFVFNYKSPDFQKEFARDVGYLDVYFDNVGGDILDFMLKRLKVKARIVLCGAISEYNSKKPKGLTNYMNIIAMRATMRGFVLMDYIQHYNDALAEIKNWLIEGKILRKFHIENGLTRAPHALEILFNGTNTGKTIIQITKYKAKL